MKKALIFFCFFTLLGVVFFSSNLVFSHAEENSQIISQRINNNQEVLYLYLNDTEGIFNYSDRIFILDSNMVYVVEQKQISEYPLNDFENQTEYSLAQIASSHIKDIFIESGVNYSSFYILEDSNKIYLLTGIEGVKDYSYDNTQDILIILTDSKVLIYGDIASEKPKKMREFPFNKGEKICFNLENIYIARKNAVVKIDYNQEEILEKLFIASNSSESYFYYCPSGVFTRGENIFVADYMNDRVAILSSSSVFYIDFVNPTSVVCTLNGQIIISHNKNEITNYDTKKTLEIRINDRPVLIKKLAIDLEDNVFVLCEYSGKSYIYKTDINLESYELLDFENPSALGYKVGGEILVYESDAIKNLSKQTILECDLVLDFYLDYADKVYAINSNNELICIDGQQITNYEGEYSQLFISNISNSLVNFNDLLLVNENTHSLLRIDGESLNIENISDHFNISDEVINGNYPHTSQYNILAKAKSDTFLFSRAIESQVSSLVNSGQTIFIRNDIDSPDNMYFALLEGETSLKWGYIYKSAVDVDAYEYTSPPVTQGKLIASCPVYKYPSVFSEIVKNYNLNESVRLLPFSSSYKDIDNKEWYRIDINGMEGYIKIQNVSTSLFSDTTPPLKFNATIKNTTTLYVKTADGNYEPYDAYLEIQKGTQIYIETPFDSTRPYTKVLFYIEDKVLDLDCYVITSEIAFDGLDIVQIIAICVIVCTLILVVLVTILLSKKTKRNNL